MDIRVEKLKQAAGGRVILEGVSLEFAAGAVNVILGPNGAGKTTLLRLLGLLDRPLRGEVFHEGLPVSALRRSQRTALRRRIGFVFQTPLLLAGTVEANLLYGPRLRGLDVTGSDNWKNTRNYRFERPRSPGGDGCFPAVKNSGCSWPG